MTCDHPFASAFPDGTWLGVFRDAGATAARIAALSPRDADAWRTMTARSPAEVVQVGVPLSTR